MRLCFKQHRPPRIAAATARTYRRIAQHQERAARPHASTLAIVSSPRPPVRAATASSINGRDKLSRPQLATDVVGPRLCKESCPCSCFSSYPGKLNRMWNAATFAAASPHAPGLRSGAAGCRWRSSCFAGAMLPSLLAHAARRTLTPGKKPNILPWSVHPPRPARAPRSAGFPSDHHALQRCGAAPVEFPAAWQRGVHPCLDRRVCRKLSVSCPCVLSAKAIFSVCMRRLALGSQASTESSQY